MNRIIAPIHPQDHSPTVANLQEALLFIVDKRGLSPGGMTLDRWKQALSGEEVAESFGPGTARLLAGLRTDLHLPDGDSVDEPTAEALNQQLGQLGAFAPVPATPLNQARTFQVEGKVVSMSRAGVGKLGIQVVDKNVGDDEKLAEAVTKEDGSYEAMFSDADLQRRGKDAPDLQAKVFVANKLLGESEIRFNASLRETLNIVLTDEASTVLPSEYATLTQDLAGHFQGNLRDLKETNDRQDISYLANKSGWDARAVAMASLSDQFSQDRTNGTNSTSIPAAFYYALFRAGWAPNPDTLYRTDANTVERVWTEAVKQGVIGSDSQDQIPAAVKVFQKIGAERLLDGQPPIGLSPLKDILTVSGVSDTAQQQQFAELYTANGGDMTAFWKAAEQSFGQQKSDRMKVDGKLCVLTINNASLIQAIHQAAGPGGVTDTFQLAKMGYHRPEKWYALLTEQISLPPEVTGDTVDKRRTAYATQLAARVRISYPTASIAELVKTGDLKIAVPEQVADFLFQHQDKFIIGRQAIGDYVNQNSLKADPQVLAEIERIHRVYQITSGDQAMAGLLKQGIDAAYHVIQYDKEEFIEAYADDLGGRQAAAYTYGRAQQIHNIILNITLNYFAARRSVPIGTHSPARFLDAQPKLVPVSQAQTIGPLPAKPSASNLVGATLEGLFGSIDFCTCEHCRSLLSPAAYLVDLLLFLDKKSAGPKNPLTVLLGRRPDIQFLPLTCENTNTALPYIDLVNEILEYFIANQTHPLSLTDYKGHDTGDISTEDLLASPQSFSDGVRDKAYTTLQNAWFPLTLPFHQPLESLRRYFTKFQVPLSLAMERLRKNDDFERKGANQYGWRDILMEEVGLSRSEYQLLTNTPNSIPLWQAYGYPTGTQDSDVIAGFASTFGLSNAKQFTRRVDISYEDLVAILKTKFVNPNSDLIPKVEALGVSFETLAELKSANNPIIDQKFDNMLAQGANAPDPAAYGGDIKAWVKNSENYVRIMGLIVLAIPVGTWSASKKYVLGDCVSPTNEDPDSNLYYVCTRAGVSAASEPSAWPATAGQTLSDGAAGATMAWTCRDGTTESNFDDWAFRYSDPTTVGQNIQAIDFVRLLRFIRLWKKLGWSIEQTDAAICSLLPPPDPTQTSAGAILDSRFLTMLPRLGIVFRVMKTLNLTPNRDLLSLLACFADIGTHGDNAFYRQMFLRPALLAQDQVFADDNYGEFLKRFSVPYKQAQPSLDPNLSNAARGQLTYNATEKDLSYIGILDPVTRKALIGTGVTKELGIAIDALYKDQRLVTHSEALRSAFGQTNNEFAQIVNALGFDGGLVKVPYQHTSPNLEQGIIDVAPGIFYDDRNSLLAYRGFFDRATLNALLGLDNITTANPKFAAAVQLLYAAKQDALAPLTLTNVTAIFRRGWLARKLKISVRELLLLLKVNSFDPFSLSADASTHPAILDLIGLVQALRNRDLKSSAALYLIWNQDLSGKSAPDPAQVLQFARTLRNDFCDIDDQFASAKDSEDSFERTQVALVYGQEVADTFFALLDNEIALDVSFTFTTAMPQDQDQNTVKSWIKAIQGIDQNVDYDDFRHRLSYSGVMSVDARSGLTALPNQPPGFEDSVQALWAKGQDAKGAFFNRYPELQQIYDLTMALGGKTLQVDFPLDSPPLDPAITQSDSRISYDSANHKLNYKGIISKVSSDSLKNLSVATDDFRAAVDTLFALGQAQTDAVLFTLRPNLARERKRQQVLQRLTAAAGVDLDSIRTWLDLQQSPYPLDSVSHAGQPAIFDFLELQSSGLDSQIYDGVTTNATPHVPATLAIGNIDFLPTVGNLLPANPAGGSISGIWTGMIEAPETGYYNLIVESDKGATIKVSIDGKAYPPAPGDLLWRNNDSITLAAGQLYQIEVRAEQIKSVLCLKWETPKRAREVIPSRYLYSPTCLEFCSDAYVRFLKAASLAAGLHLTANELAHFANDPDYKINKNGALDPANGTGWLNYLPRADNLNQENPWGPGPADALNKSLSSPLKALLSFSEIKADISPDDESLLSILEDPASAAKKSDGPLYTLTGWNLDSLHDVLANFGLKVADLTTFKHFERLYQVFGIISQMRISGSALIAATTNDPDRNLVRDLQTALRALYEADDWREVVQPINDELRALERDALVAYILQQMRMSPDPDLWSINTADKLFEYFLMDVQMEPGIPTSRIRHALSSVQLFTERWLMNLEKNIVPSTQDVQDQWEWRKRYRVWEANRKVFFWPENWMDPALRDNQSDFYKSTMSELLQSDITEDSAATALQNYLSKLEEVAKLEPCGMFYVEADPEANQNEEVHVVSRTPGAHRKYYYRLCDGGSWTPWVQIGVDIQDNPVLPVVWNGRLFLFWLKLSQEGMDLRDQASTKGPPDKTGNEIPVGGCTPSQLKDNAKADGTTNTQIKFSAILCWSERFNGSWQSMRTSPVTNPLRIPRTGYFDSVAGDNTFDRTQLELAVSFEPNNAIKIIVSYADSTSYFFLHNSHSAPDLQGFDDQKSFSSERIITTYGNISSDWMVTTVKPQLRVSYSGSDTSDFIFTNNIDAWPPTTVVRAVQPRQTPSSVDPWTPPFLFEDRRRVFCVRTTAEYVLLKDWMFYGSFSATVNKQFQTSPLIQAKKNLLPEFSGPVEQQVFGIANPAQITRVVSKDAYINKGLGNVGTVSFNGKEIGPTGSLTRAIKTH